MAESASGSSPTACMRLKVSRQEIPASTRMRVDELCTIALFPRLPLASTETDTPMAAAYAPPLWKRDNFLDSPPPLSKSRDSSRDAAFRHILLRYHAFRLIQ